MKTEKEFIEALTDTKQFNTLLELSMYLKTTFNESNFSSNPYKSTHEMRTLPQLQNKNIIIHEIDFDSRSIFNLPKIDVEWSMQHGPMFGNEACTKLIDVHCLYIEQNDYRGSDICISVEFWDKTFEIREIFYNIRTYFSARPFTNPKEEVIIVYSNY